MAGQRVVHAGRRPGQHHDEAEQEGLPRGREPVGRWEVARVEVGSLQLASMGRRGGGKNVLCDHGDVLGSSGAQARALGMDYGDLVEAIVSDALTSAKKET